MFRKSLTKVAQNVTLQSGLTTNRSLRWADATVVDVMVVGSDCLLKRQIHLFATLNAFAFDDRP